MTKNTPTEQSNLRDKAPKLPDKASEFKKGKTARQEIGDQAADQLSAKEKRFDIKEYIGKKLDSDALNKLKEVRGTIKSKDVLNLQETNPNIIAELFCEPSDLSKEWTFKTYGNKSVEACIGLVDVYRNDLSVRAVTVANKKGKTKEGKREGMGGNFYTGRGYIFIFEGYKVTPMEKLSETETKELNAKFANESMHQMEELKNKVPENLQKRFGDKLLPRLVKESVRQGVDSKYLLGLLQQENGAEDQEFGVTSHLAMKGFLNQLRWAATIVKNNELRYEGFGKKAKDSKGNYTMGFLAFNSEKYAPSAASETNKSHFANILNIYEKSVGTKIEGSQKEVDEGIKLAKVNSSNSLQETEAYKEAMERLSKSPQKHTIMEMPKNARLTSDYMWRGSIKNENGTVRSWGGWHAGVDIGMGMHNYQLTAPENGQIVEIRSNPKGAGYYITYKCPDKNGDMLYFTYMHCDQESWEQLKQSGKTSFQKGEVLLKTGASGNATTAEGKHLWHLHMEVRRQKDGHGDKILTDPFPYLPKEMQAQIMVYRDVRRDSARYKKTEELAKVRPNREGLRHLEGLSS